MSKIGQVQIIGDRLRWPLFPPAVGREIECGQPAQKFGQDRETAPDLLLICVTEVQLRGSTAFRQIGIEQFAGHEGHAAPDGLGQQGARVHMSCKAEPEKQIARWCPPCSQIAKMALQCGGDKVALASIGRRYPDQTFVPACSAHLLQHQPLADAIAAKT